MSYNHLSPTPKPSPIQLKNNDTMKTLLHHSAPFKVHAVEMPEDSFDVKIEFYDKYFAIRYRLPAPKGVTKIGSKCLMFKDFGGRKKYPKELIAVGTYSPYWKTGYLGQLVLKPQEVLPSSLLLQWNTILKRMHKLLSSNGLDPNKKYLILKSEE